jgi:diguanylate cyclase (GGDEF)-like protein
VLDALPELAFLLTKDGRYLEIFGAQDSLIVTDYPNVIGKTLHDVLPPKLADHFLRVIQNCIESNTVQILEYELRVQAGLRLFEGRVAPLKLTDTIEHVVWFARDITEQKKQEATLTFLAYHDPLTRLPNRVALFERLKAEHSRCQRHRKVSAVLFIDLDNFKTINDELTHALGDALLQQVAIRLRNQIRGEDFVARIGGDEFIVVLSMIDNDADKALKDATIRAHAIQKSICDITTLEGHSIAISASIGIAMISEHNDDSETVLKQADQAMYQSKQTGRSRVTPFCDRPNST